MLSFENFVIILHQLKEKILYHTHNHIPVYTLQLKR